MAAEGGSILRLGGSAGAQASIAARVGRDEVILGLRPEDISRTARKQTANSDLQGVWRWWRPWGLRTNPTGTGPEAD
ncbi:hypothetical protein [Kaistia defluvii]|uniref:hypothetical protein n=1 Tax=Kaistia defluvii TaxID=410841 RepID=UPI003F51342C